LFWKIVRAGVHDQLWQNFFWKGMWKKQLPAISFLAIRSNPTVLANSETNRAIADSTDSSRGRREPRETRIENDGFPARLRSCDSPEVIPLVHHSLEIGTAFSRGPRIERVEKGRRYVEPGLPTVQKLTGDVAIAKSA
jgi:hypothetical protein